MDSNPQKAWRISEWRRAVPLSQSQIYEMLASGTLPSAKIGGARFIIESPVAFLARHATAGQPAA
jgi:predicted DNA-binding transcriptional regulator AlpA